MYILIKIISIFVLTNTENMERRKRTIKGTSQRACLFKIDNELLGWLERQPNKGRYVNELIRHDMQASGGDVAAAVEAERKRQAAEAASTTYIDGETAMRVYCHQKKH